MAGPGSAREPPPVVVTSQRESASGLVQFLLCNHRVTTK